MYVLVDDAIRSRAVAIAPPPGSVPACTDAELLAVALIRHLLGRRGKAGFLAEAARDWAHPFPRLLAVFAAAGPGSMLPFDLLSATLTQLDRPLPG